MSHHCHSTNHFSMANHEPQTFWQYLQNEDANSSVGWKSRVVFHWKGGPRRQTWAQWLNFSLEKSNMVPKCRLITLALFYNKCGLCWLNTSRAWRNYFYLTQGYSLGKPTIGIYLKHIPQALSLINKKGILISIYLVPLSPNWFQILVGNRRVSLIQPLKLLKYRSPPIFLNIFSLKCFFKKFTDMCEQKIKWGQQIPGLGLRNFQITASVFCFR